MAAPLPFPTEALLREAALAHLARYATSRANLIRVLDRRIARWAGAQAERDPEQEGTARAAARDVVAALATAGLVDDAAFAQMRARRLLRGGRSRAAVAAHLAARGVGAAERRTALPEDAARDLGAALVLARRRRLGPFRAGPADPRRELAVFARAGFSQALAERALHTAPEEAEALIRRLLRE